MDYSNSSIGKLSMDYHESEEYKSNMKWLEQFWFLIHYAVVIPFFLFLISRLLRCLRHRGWISRGSERRMVADIEGRLTSIAGATTTPLKGAAIPTRGFKKHSSCLSPESNTPSSVTSSSPPISFNGHSQPTSLPFDDVIDNK